MNLQPATAQPLTEREQRAADASVATMEHFSQVSDVYNEIRTTDIEPIDYIREHLGTQSRIIGAEVGAGGGRYSHLLLRDVSNLQLTLTDLNESMLEQAGHFLRDQGTRNFELLKANSASLPLATGSLDCLMTFNAVHHFDLTSFLEEAGRALKNGGQLFIYTRLPSQNACNIWGRYFPDFARMETRLYGLDQLTHSMRRVPSLEMDSMRFFRYPRRSSLQRLLEQARNGHYSTFSLYGTEHFERSILRFEANLREAFPNEGDIRWVDENIMLVARATRK